MRPLRRETTDTEVRDHERRIEALERRYITAGLLPVAVATVPGAQTFVDGQNYALTGLAGEFVGSGNAEGVAASIDIVNNDTDTFEVDEALLAKEQALYVFYAGVQFGDSGGFPAGRRAAIYPDVGAATWVPISLGGYYEEEIMELPPGEQTWTLSMCALGWIIPGVVTTDKEFVIEVLVTGGDVDINGGWALVCRLTPVPDI